MNTLNKNMYSLKEKVWTMEKINNNANLNMTQKCYRDVNNVLEWYFSGRLRKQ